MHNVRSNYKILPKYELMYEISWYSVPTATKTVLTDHQKLPLRTLKLKEIPYATPQPSKRYRRTELSQ